MRVAVCLTDVYWIRVTALRPSLDLLRQYRLGDGHERSGSRVDQFMARLFESAARSVDIVRSSLERRGCCLQPLGRERLTRWTLRR